MARPPLEVEVRGGRELARISRELRRMGDGKQLKAEFGRELRAVAAPLVPAVRASIKAIPADSGHHSGLRARLARATRLQVRTVGKQAGVSIQVDGRKMPNHQKALQAYMEGLKRPWRHPVFGNTNVWVKQEPHPYFYKTVRPLGGASRVAVNRVLDKTAQKIT
ncbi:hypothetical protein [Streptomyces hygroscopicus]|uniref:hypothetical protein n=1 Tax=Streptomyces hygroscopicus TaxID=1912 RepID=UPI002240E196|nr:hypothetical protein [Streptomyces hygroscopicus]